MISKNIDTYGTECKKPLLSICIPTYNRAEYLDKCIDSIVRQNEFNSEDVELVISDNASDDNTEEVVKKYQERHNNIFYSINEENISDKNFPTVIGNAHGVFRKLCNDTLIFSDESIKHILNIIRKNINEKPVLFFMNYSNRKIRKNIYTADCFDTFVKIASFWTTWIGGFGVWEDDFEKIENKFDGCELHLWQTKVLFEIVAHKKMSIIDNVYLFFNQEVQKKDVSYGLYQVFYKNYLSLYEQYLMNQVLSENIYKYLRKQLLSDFFINWIVNFYFDCNKYKISSGDNITSLILSEYRHDSYFIYSFLKLKIIFLKRYIKNIIIWKKYNKFILPFFTERMKTYLFRRKWRRLNLCNETMPVNIFRLEKVSVGIKTYGSLNVSDFSPAETKLIIGNYCSISPGVKFLLGGEHQIDSISTFPFKVKCFGYEREAGSKGDIVIGDDVWIGTNAIICSGVKIGQGAIVAAGAVVTKNVEPYAIVGGNPAKVIRYRFDEDIIMKLHKIDLVKMFDNLVSSNINEIYLPLRIDNIDIVLEKITGGI